MKYIEPEMEIILFAFKDVVTESVLEEDSNVDDSIVAPDDPNDDLDW